jgi:NAD(P)-dependent dehydrogenase (short-subunit alcohol dehydrogenase family)
MSTQKSPRIVVITGASAGAGRATAQAFARQGANLGLLARGRAGLEGARVPAPFQKQALYQYSANRHSYSNSPIHRFPPAPPRRGGNLDNPGKLRGRYSLSQLFRLLDVCRL